jgi:hypothetical protein
MLQMTKIKKPAFINDDREQAINADFSVAVAVDTAKLGWQASPAVGVKRKRLELVGKDEPRLTTLVKFMPGSSFKRHGHDGGEEIFVLSGVFSDENGDYGAGSYIRNPPGSFHAPFTEEGCTILVKLRQFQPMDRKQLVIDTRADTTRWSQTDEPGVSQLKLHHFSKEQVGLYRIYAQCWITLKNYTEGIEIFVYEGSISIRGADYAEGGWLRYPAGSKFKIKSPAGARIYMKQGAYPDDEKN